MADHKPKGCPLDSHVGCYGSRCICYRDQEMLFSEFKVWLSDNHNEYVNRISKRALILRVVEYMSSNFEAHKLA